MAPRVQDWLFGGLGAPPRPPTFGPTALLGSTRIDGAGAVSSRASTRMFSFDASQCIVIDGTSSLINPNHTRCEQQALVFDCSKADLAAYCTKLDGRGRPPHRSFRYSPTCECTCTTSLSNCRVIFFTSPPRIRLVLPQNPMFGNVAESNCIETNIKVYHPLRLMTFRHPTSRLRLIRYVINKLSSGRVHHCYIIS